MANKYLISSEPTTGIIYYTANATGDLVSIGSSLDWTQGFSDSILTLLNNDDYKSLTNGKLWIDSDTGDYSLNVTTTGEGSIASTDTTAINVQGYSGVNSLTITGDLSSGGKIAISFDKFLTYQSYDPINKIWQSITVDQVPTLGMTMATVNALLFENYASIFARTQIDFYIYLKGTDYITNIVASLPPNGAPVIKNFKSTLDSIHAQDITITFDIIDNEEDSCTYEVSVNGVDILATTVVPDGGNISLIIQNTSMIVGSNAVKVIATDSRGASSTNTAYITKNDSAPTFIGILTDNMYRVTIGDADNDMIKYKVTFNGIDMTSYGDLVQSPLQFTYVIDKRKILIGKTNTLIVTAMDSLGVTSTVEEDFIGTYYGILFEDSGSNFYSTDIGDVLKKLDFGTVISSQTSLTKELKILNKTNSGITGLRVSVPSSLVNGAIPELCATQDFATPVTSLQIGSLVANENISIWTRIRSSSKIIGKEDFTITTTATTN